MVDLIEQSALFVWSVIALIVGAALMFLLGVIAIQEIGAVFSKNKEPQIDNSGEWERYE